MKANQLEKAVMKRCLEDVELEATSTNVALDDVDVAEREFTGVGFLTEFSRSPTLKLFPEGTSFRWGKVGARLNASKIETGYVVYVDDGYLTTVEGYTYGDEWPHEVKEIELYELKPGVDLNQQGAS